MEPVLGGACGAVGRKSFLSNDLLIFIWGVLVSGHEVTVCGPCKVVSSQRRPCMLGGGKHLTEMELNR